MFQHTPQKKKDLRPKMGFGPFAILLIGLASLTLVADSQAQYEVRKPGGAKAQQASLTVTEPASGTAWTQGKRYEITWKSEGIRGSVKIDLIDPQGKATVLVRQTMNSGKYSFMLMRNVADGDYKIRVSSVDNKTVGETAGTVHVGKITDEVEKALVADTDQPAVITRPTGTVGTIDQTPTSIVPDVGTVTRDPVQLEDAGGITGITGTTVVQVGNLTPILVPESDLQQVLLPGGDLSVASNLQDANIVDVQPNAPTLEVTQPVADDFWVAGTPYPIRWNSTNLDDPVKIHMVHAVSASDYVFYPVTYNTENDGTFDFTVPAMLGCNYKNFYLQVATLDEQVKAFSTPIDVYHEPADMTGKVIGLMQHDNINPYIDTKWDEWLQFDVWFRNNGTQQATTVQTIRVIVIKEPEEVVIDGGHVEFGFGSMAPRLWYSTPNPLKFKIYGCTTWGGKTVNLEVGAYRVEVTVDPLNLLNEDPPMREDNDFVQRFEIR